MEKPKIEQIFTEKSEFCEKTSQEAVETLIPGQAISISELVQRFERGQRLNVHNLPMNTMFGSEEEADHNSEHFEDAAPDDVHDVVDVEAYYNEHQQRKADYIKKKKESKQAKPAEAQQEPSTPQTPDDPAH